MFYHTDFSLDLFRHWTCILIEQNYLQDGDLMESYTDFALVYDTFMDETPYGEWAAFIHELIDEYGISKPCLKALSNENLEDNLLQEKNLVVELGCGTGNFTAEMSKLGYDMIGIDNSSSMLNIAMQKKEKDSIPAFYLEQDMRDFELFGTAGTFVSVCDSVNYLTDREDIVKMMKLVNNYLFPDGIFIFDFNTVHKYRDVIGDTTIAEDREDCAFIWDNFFDEETNINEYDLTIFVQEEGDSYRRFFETHYQRGYTLEEMLSILEESGLAFLKAIDADTHNDADESSERIYIIARKDTDSNMQMDV